MPIGEKPTGIDQHVVGEHPPGELASITMTLLLRKSVR